MTTFEEAGAMLDEIIDEMPPEIFADLNGGVNLLPDEKIHPDGVGDDLYVMGEYNHNNLGRYINIFYGSVMTVYSYLPPRRLKTRLAEILKHEITHHLESLAGEKDLVIKDQIDYEKYKMRRERRVN